ncbi:hypothetical protein BASA60_003502 [Batrachochytrium salamandrivorans]|nr:hypothetical protein BASA62_004341 [Batrachochytrium salamandrivorans]KAH6578841.1 hypothetical protein BASA60_003502 [Batrachochytrium salamandrivorans]
MAEGHSLDHATLSPGNTKLPTDVDEVDEDHLRSSERKRSRGETSHRSKTKDSSDRRHRSRSRERSRKDRSDRSDRSDRDRRRDRDLDERRSRSPGREESRRSSSHERRSSRKSSYSPAPETVPLHLRKRKIENWDVPPVGFEGLTAEQAKASGHFQLPSHLLKSATTVVQDRGGVLGMGANGMNPSGFDSGAENFLISLGLGMGANGSIPMGMDGAAAETNGRNSMSGSVSGGMNMGFGNTGMGAGAGVDIGMGGMGMGMGGIGMGSRAPPPIARQYKRLYFGNIPTDCTEERILSFASRNYEQLGVSKDPGNAAVNAYINRERNYAFVEFRSPEEATRAMALDGILFDGNTLKVRRPKDYNPESAPEGTTHLPGVVATNVQDSADKIFVGAIPTYLTEDQVQELLKTFGELKSFSLIRDSLSGFSKGFAFCEYVDGQITDAACQGLNGMELGEKKLIVQRASVGSNKTSAPIVGPSSLLPVEILATIAKDPCKITRVLLLLNMVVTKDLIADEDYQDILLDVKEECERFGSVLDVCIPRPINGQSVPGVGKIFVKFTDIKQSAAAQHALAGRKFADRVVIASFYDEDKFDKQDL